MPLPRDFDIFLPCATLTMPWINTVSKGWLFICSQDEKIILGTTTQINWEKTDRETCLAMIEVRITPMRNKGYDHIANLLCKYEKVSACYLMSGGSDLMLIYDGKTLREVAEFVSDKIAPLEGVLSTTTHFILKKYKTNGIMYDEEDEDNRQFIIL